MGDGPLTSRFERIRELFPQGRVSGYAISDTQHPDPYDWHVVNAALSARAEYLLTSDTKFDVLQRCPEADEWPFEVHAPDSFFDLVHQSSSRLVQEVTKDEYLYWMSKPGSHRPLSEALRLAGAPEFAERVAGYICNRSY
ncbi:MAG: hypothetical protein QM662_13725 [Gordonia sp. (in: high G+C Gram-positive bacteria)]